LSTFALEGSEAPVAGGRSGRAPLALRFPDMVVLVLALPVFVLADWPLLGYAVCAGAWLAQHAVLAFAERRAKAALERGDRRLALGIIGGATLGRLWLVTAAILIVGLVAEREDGLAAAVLTFLLVTVHFGSLAFAKLLYPEEAA
jgi:hypothetical protein